MPYKNKDDQKKAKRLHYLNNIDLYLERAKKQKKPDKDKVSFHNSTYYRKNRESILKRQKLKRRKPRKEKDPTIYFADPDVIKSNRDNLIKKMQFRSQYF
jgi:hypothetical protein